MKRLFRKRIHISWRIALLSTAFIAGVSLSLLANPLQWYRLDVLAFGLVVGGICLVRGRLVHAIFIVCAGLAIGLFHGSAELVQLRGIEGLIGSEQVVTGIVAQDPSISVDGDVQFRLVDLRISNTPVVGSLWVSTSSVDDIKRSFGVVVRGEISEGFGSLPVSMYRAELLAVDERAGADSARDVRDNFAERVRTTIDEPQASLGIGFLLGQKSTLPEDLEQNLRLLGLTHIVVASGYNLTIIIRFARRVLHKISRFTALFGGLTLLVGFIAMTGLSPSMTRAGLITSISLLAWYVGRRMHPFVLLPCTAALTIWFRPEYAWGDIGWLLSFLAFFGVLVVAPLLHAYFFGDKKPSSLRQVLFETISAQIMTAPLIILLFSSYSPLALLANLLVVPSIPLAMLATFSAGMSTFIGGPITWMSGLIAELLLGYTTTIVDMLALLPLATQEISLGIVSVLSMYGFMVVTLFYMWRKTKFSWADQSVIE